LGVELRKGLSVTDSVESKAGGLRAALLRLFPVTLVIAALFFVGFQNGYVRIQYPTRDDYPVRGVDVSRHQNEIDWPALATGSEIDFAFMKASEGTDLRDPRFAENWSEAKGQVARSAYHFFTFCTPGEAQARNFLTAAPEAGELPRAIDVEFSGNCTKWETEEQIRTQLERFVEIVRAEDGRTPILYVTKESYNRIVRGGFDGVPIWMREIVFRPSESDYPNLLFWQYAGTGRLEGVETLVDLNVFVGSWASFEKQLDEGAGTVER
jgi:lysozyme